MFNFHQVQAAKPLAKTTPPPSRRRSLESSGGTQWASALAKLSSSINTTSITDTSRPAIKPIRVRLPSTDILNSPMKKEQSKDESVRGNFVTNYKLVPITCTLSGYVLAQYPIVSVNIMHSPLTVIIMSNKGVS
jgi:hypothetical protein